MASSTNAITVAQRTIYLEAQAPFKPAAGAHCNGCGICCQYDPCPLGVMLSMRRTGACVASVWDAERRLYRCAALVQPIALLLARLPFWMHGAVPPLAWALGRMAPRWIAAGAGCDCELEIQSSARLEARMPEAPDHASVRNVP